MEVENARLSAARERDVEAMNFLSHELKNRFVAVKRRAPCCISAVAAIHGHPISLSSHHPYPCTHLIQLRGLTESAHLSVAEYASHLLSAPHNVREVYADTLAGIDRGIFLCMNQGVALQLAHDSYHSQASHVDLRSALHAASGRRADVSVDQDVPVSAACVPDPSHTGVPSPPLARSHTGCHPRRWLALAQLWHILRTRTTTRTTSTRTRTRQRTPHVPSPLARSKASPMPPRDLSCATHPALHPL